jgi:hypothetical protein
LETNDDQVLNGGVLIWHIDESVIRAEKSNNAINADPLRRGVDLEEADGAQDIGRTDTDQQIGLSSTGGPYDFWWSGNNYSVITDTDTLQLYQNRFGPQTTPATHSNSGGATFLAFDQFSDQDPVATLRLRKVTPENSWVRLVVEHTLAGAQNYAVNKSQNSAYPPSLGYLHGISDTVLVIPSAQHLVAGTLTNGNWSTQELLNAPPQQPLFSDPIVVGEASNANTSADIRAWTYQQGQWTLEWQNSAPATRGFVSQRDPNQLDLDGTTQQITLSDGVISTPFSTPQQRTPLRNGSEAILANNRLEIIRSNDSKEIQLSAGSQRQYVGSYFYTSAQTGYYVLTDQQLWVTAPNASDSNLRLITESKSLSWPAIVDLDQDERLDMLVTQASGKALWGYTHQGSVLNRFPLEAPSGVRFWGPPLVADLTGDQQLELLIPGTDGYSYALYAYTLNGIPLDGFPLTVGGISQADQQPIHPVLDASRNMLWAVSPQGDLKGWEIPQLGEVAWSGHYDPNTDSNKMSVFSSNQPVEVSNRLLIPDETYNWPNPANDHTYFRFQVRESAEISVIIHTLSGEKVDELRYDALEGASQEIHYSTASLSSGVYYVMIKAQNGNQSDHETLKLVVVR